MIEREENIQKWSSRFYHVYADGKRVKELDVKTIRRLLQNRTNDWVILSVDKSWVSIWQGPKHIGMNIKQFQEILADKQKESEQ